MIAAVNTFQRLRTAVETYANSDQETPLILILQTPGGINHRFIVTGYGIEKQDCNKTGAELYEPNR